MGKFTPGPWMVGMATGHNGGTIYASDDNAVAQVFGAALHRHVDEQPEWAAESMANARLIAAAPDLLDAVKAALNMTDGDGTPPNWDWLRSVVSKAEGK